MAKQKSMGLLGICKRVGDADMAKLGELTKRAKGSRTAAAFSAECGLDPGTISRIINVKYTKRVSDDVVAAIAVNAAGVDWRMFKEFLDAQGLVIPSAEGASATEVKRLYSECLEQLRVSLAMAQQAKAEPVSATAKRKENLRIRLQEAIQNRLINEGYRVARAKDTIVMTHGDLPFYADFVLETDALEGEGIDRWGFIIDEAAGTAFCRSIDHIASCAYFDHPADHGVRITVITTDWRTFYASRKTLMDYGSAQDSLSILLINDRYGLVEAEYVLPREFETLKPFGEGKSDDEIDWADIYGDPVDIEGQTVHPGNRMSER